MCIIGEFHQLSKLLCVKSDVWSGEGLVGWCKRWAKGGGGLVALKSPPSYARDAKCHQLLKYFGILEEAFFVCACTAKRVSYFLSCKDCGLCALFVGMLQEATITTAAELMIKLLGEQ